MLTDIFFLPEVSDIQKQAVLDFVDIWQNDSEFISIYTSGSTGTPKEINVSKQVMVASAKATGRYFMFDGSHNNLLALSTDYIAGMMQVVRSLVFEMTLVVAPVASNPLLLLENQSIDFAAFVPMQVQAILADPKSKKVYQSIKNVIIGGAPLSANLFDKISFLDNASFATFGMTETVSHVALKAIKLRNELYKSLPDISFEETPENCLVINAPSISKTPILTNDRIELIDKYSFKWLGRSDFVINSGGVKIQPEQVENKLSSVISDEFYISKTEDELLGERVVLEIESMKYSADKLALLKIALAKELNQYEVPKEIRFQTQFKRTASGKLIR